MQGRLTLAGALAMIGAVAILVGLSLEWFEPEISAWTAFEIVDLLLAAIALGVVVVALSRSAERPRVAAAAGWLPIVALAALVLVLAALVNPPPAAIDRSLEIGAWVTLGGAILLVVAAILATTKVSVVVTMRPRSGERPRRGARPPAEDPDWATSEHPLERAHDEPMIDDRPESVIDDEWVEPVDEGIVPPDEVDSEGETRPFPQRRAE